MHLAHQLVCGNDKAANDGGRYGSSDGVATLPGLPLLDVVGKVGVAMSALLLVTGELDDDPGLKDKSRSDAGGDMFFTRLSTFLNADGKCWLLLLLLLLIMLLLLLLLLLLVVRLSKW